jgi:peptidoglycan/LPS O-acetylase OafA/YrhL
MSTTSMSTGNRRVRELDGLRGIAILLILLFHFAAGQGPLKIFAPYLEAGWIGVDLFFVLSGYLIIGILIDTSGRDGWYRNFIVRRSLRIFPLYYAALLFHYPFHDQWWYFGYVSNIKVFQDNQWPAIAALIPLWSLSIEEQFYLLFPLVILFVSRKALGRFLIGAVVAAFLIRVALVLAIPANITGTYTLMPSRIDALALGGLVALARRDFPHVLKQRWIPWVTVLSAAVFVLISVTYRPSPWITSMRTIGFTALDLGFAGLLVLVVGQRIGFLSAICRTPFLVWTGTISYGIYILHIPVAVFVRRITASMIAPRGSADFVLCTAASLCAAWISWVIFESPILKLKDRLAPALKPSV